jgi:hypothetical protein
VLELPDVVLLGREEPVTTENRWAHDRYDMLTAHIGPAYVNEHTDQVDAWKGHNVFVQIGPYGAWTALEWQTWRGLGRVPVPHLVARVRLDLGLGLLYPVTVDPVNPPLLHWSHRMLGPGKVADKIAAFYEAVEQAGLLHDPAAATRKGWERIVREAGYRTTDTSFTLRPLDEAA